MRLTGVVIRAVRNQDDADPRSRRELGAHALPTRGCGLRVDRKMRTELIAAARQMIDERFVAAGGEPSNDVGLWPTRAAEAAPEDDKRQVKTGGDRRQRGGMPERV